MLHNNVAKGRCGVNFVITDKERRETGVTYISAHNALKNVRECIDRHTLDGYFEGFYPIEYASKR